MSSQHSVVPHVGMSPKPGAEIEDEHEDEAEDEDEADDEDEDPITKQLTSLATLLSSDCLYVNGFCNCAFGLNSEDLHALIKLT